EIRQGRSTGDDRRQALGRAKGWRSELLRQRDADRAGRRHDHKASVGSGCPHKTSTRVFSEHLVGVRQAGWAHNAREADLEMAEERSDTGWGWWRERARINLEVDRPG